jgi:acyl-coenzyme A synthetase/AMP-(fatty) acid ligase
VDVTAVLRLEAMHHDAARLCARRELAARWQAEGFHTGISVAAQAQRAAAAHPRTRLVFASQERPAELDLAGLWRRSAALASALSARGVSRNDAVAVQLPNWAEAAVSYVATAALGAVVLPIVHGYGPQDTNWILARVRPRAYILPERLAGADYVARLDAMPAAAEVETVVVVGERAPAGAVRWGELEAAGAREAAVEAGLGGEPFLITFTSGTTAEPKGVVHSHDSFLAELRSMPSPPQSPVAIRTMQPWPAGHIGGMTAILGPLVHGFDTFLLDRWETGAVVDLIRAERIEATSGVPTVLLRLIDALEARGIDLPLRELTSGGAGIPPLLIERAERLGWHIGRCYGSSEHPSATASPRSASRDHRWYSDGRPLAGTALRILDDEGRDVAVGTEGEIALIGPEQFLGYSDPALNDAAFTPEGWLLTGDIGVVDADGFLTVTDRKKDIIIRGGENISSVEVESILLRHPAVAEAVAVSSPDPDYGERICVFVVPQPGAAIDLAGVRAHFAGAGVQKQKTPELLRIVTEAELPRTPSGKVQKRALRDRLREEVTRGSRRNVA